MPTLAPSRSSRHSRPVTLIPASSLSLSIFLTLQPSTSASACHPHPSHPHHENKQDVRDEELYGAAALYNVVGEGKQWQVRRRAFDGSLHRAPAPNPTPPARLVMCQSSRPGHATVRALAFRALAR